MKFCTKIRIDAAHVDDDGILVADKVEIIDMSFVPDDHKFGADEEDPRFLHIEGGG
jgi:hypothetical protein